MPSTLNKYPTGHVDYYALRDLTYGGVTYLAHAKVPAEGWRNVETLVRNHYIVAVTEDRNALPKMFLREIRSPEYVTAKYGFTPSTSGLGTYAPGEHVATAVDAYVAAHPTQLGAILIAELAGRNRATVNASLLAAYKSNITLTPSTGAHGSTTATVINNTANGAGPLGVCTSVKFAAATGSSFSIVSNTIHVTAPTAGSAGAVNVTLVGFPGGDLVLASAWTYS